MSAFARAARVLNADPNLGTDALYKAGGIGAGVALRVIRSQPDQIADGFGAPIISATDVLHVTAADVPAWSQGDTFTIGAEILTVQHAERDETGTTWRVLCQR